MFTIMLLLFTVSKIFIKSSKINMRNTVYSNNKRNTYLLLVRSVWILHVVFRGIYLQPV